MFNITLAQLNPSIMNLFMKYGILVSAIILFSLFSCKEVASNKERISHSNSTQVIENIVPLKKDTTTYFKLPQNNLTKGEINNLSYGCSYNDNISDSSIELYYPNDRELEEVKSIVAYSGLPMNFDVYAANVNNALATIIDQRRIILYNKKLFSFVDHFSNSYWVTMSILAHEVGHHLSGHTLDTKTSPHKIELEADKFSGFILYKLGATKSQATSAIKMLGNENESVSHPSKRNRIIAIENGWEEAATLRYEGAIPPPPSRKIPDFIEYTTKKLWGSDKFIDGTMSFDNSGVLMGTITEIDPDYNSGAIEIFTEKGLDDSKVDDFLIRKKEMFMVPLDMDLGTAIENKMSKAEWSWLSEVFKPGRRIMFRYVSVGSGGNLYLTYFKVIR